MVSRQITPVATTEEIRFETGTILVGMLGRVKILRSRTADGLGWNCQDGAPITDVEAEDSERWTPYSQDQLIADLVLARDVRELGGHRVLGGGIATWDACSGRPCILPKLARLVQRSERPVREQGDWTAADWLPNHDDE